MRALLFLLVIFSVIVWPLYLFVEKHQVAPSSFTINIAKDIPTYPNSQTWEVNNNTGFCIERFFNCDTSVSVLFSTKSSWPEIYNFYRGIMASYNWQTNSQIFTSIPGSIVFTNSYNCSAELAPAYNLIDKENTGSYKFEVSCQTK